MLMLSVFCFDLVGITIPIVVYWTMAYEVELLPPAVEFLNAGLRIISLLRK